MRYNGDVFTNESGEKYRRVNKTEARNLANKGVLVVVCACNMNPFSTYWNMCSWFDLNGEREAFDGYDTFDKFVNAYEYYNCSYETGYYASYYVGVSE